MPPPTPFTNAYSRIWFQRGGPGPSRAANYHGNWKAGALAWKQGDLTIIREPDPNTYGKFINVGRFRGEPGQPELPIMARYTYQRSELLKAAREECDHALQVHIGQCQDPQDMARGWEKILVLEGAAITSYGTGELGALDQRENAAINEDVPFVGTDAYEIIRINLAEQAASSITREITSVTVCDRVQCGSCGIQSDGCQVVFALEGGVSASPGASPKVFYTSDGGANWSSRSVTTLSTAQQGSKVMCVGSYVVVLSADDPALHYIATSDLLNGSGSWTRVATGFVAAHGPADGFSNGASDTWFVGLGGYIYHTTDPSSGVTVSDAGSATSQDLNKVRFYDALNGVAIGASNAIVYTTNGGTTWTVATGPAVGVVLNTVSMHTLAEWLVGTAGGKLFYTLDRGVTWTEIAFPGSGAGSVRSLAFSTPTVGYMAHSTATPSGLILRTIDGGHSWYVLPEGAGSIPANNYVKSLAVCEDPNIVFGGGLGSNAVDGFLVKAA